MTPKEKAKELVDKMYMLDDPNGNYPMCFDIAKECALVTSNEVMMYLDQIILPNPFKQYWNEVKKEIQKL